MIRNLAGGRKQVICDTCGSEQLTRDSFPVLLAEMKAQGWWNRRVGDDYEHHCPGCTHELAKPQDAWEPAVVVFECRRGPRPTGDGRPPSCRNCKHGGFNCKLDGQATTDRGACRDWEDRDA